MDDVVHRYSRGGAQGEAHGCGERATFCAMIRRNSLGCVIPRQNLRKFTCDIPAGTGRDGELDLRFARLVAAHAVVAVDVVRHLRWENQLNIPGT